MNIMNFKDKDSKQFVLLLRSKVNKNVYLVIFIDIPMASESTSTYAQLTSRETWHTWLSSITDLALNFDVWKYVDPEGTEEVPRPLTDNIIRTGL